MMSLRLETPNNLLRMIILQVGLETPNNLLRMIILQVGTFHQYVFNDHMLIC